MMVHEFRYLTVNGKDLPPFAGQYNGSLLITGSAKCLHDDLRAAREHIPASSVMAVNESGIWLDENIVHWFSFHGDKLPSWKVQRDKRVGYEPIILHTVDGHDNGDTVSWPFSVGGSSALGACIVALAMGYTNIVLCGCPLDNSGYIAHNSKDTSNFLNEISGPEANRWLSLRDYLFRGRVRSMSGRTKEWLGSL